MSDLVLPRPTGWRLSCLWRHAPERLDAIRPLVGASWLLDSECERPIRVGDKWCPGSAMRHDHIEIVRCSRCGRRMR